MFFHAFPFLLYLGKNKYSSQCSQASNHRGNTYNALAHPNQYEPANDGNKRNNKSVMRTSRLTRHIPGHDLSFQSLAMSTLPLSHRHDALRAIWNHFVIFGEKRGMWQRPGKRYRLCDG